MKTKSTLIVVALTALLALPALRAAEPDDAPPPPPRDGPDFQEMREHRMEHLDYKLKLTDAQKTQIEAIWDKSEAAGKALHDDAALERRARRKQFRALMKSTHDEIRAVLTPDQQKIFDTMRPPRGGPEGHRPPPPNKDDAAPRD